MHSPDALKKTMLENALQNIKCFRDIRTSEGLEAAKGRGELGYHAYLSLLQNVAALPCCARAGAAPPPVR